MSFLVPSSIDRVSPSVDRRGMSDGIAANGRCSSKVRFRLGALCERVEAGTGSRAVVDQYSYLTTIHRRRPHCSASSYRSDPSRRPPRPFPLCPIAGQGRDRLRLVWQICTAQASTHRRQSATKRVATVQPRRDSTTESPSPSALFVQVSLICAHNVAQETMVHTYSTARGLRPR